MTEFKYRAFLSYSHRDTAWARWLHRALESYRVDKDLRGRETAIGPAPSSLRPIFRDRDDFSAGHSLTDQTRAALEASQFLIVVCSPNAARSKYVDEEIRSFKARGGSERVILIIVDGEPGDAERECFPPNLRFTIRPDGQPTNEREEPIAADARPQGDGKDLAKLKVVAALLGVPLDEIARRAARARRRQISVRIGLAAIGAALVVVAVFTGWSMNLFSDKLSVAEDLNTVRDAADLCEDAAATMAQYRIPEARQITLASECTQTFEEFLAGLLEGTPVPKRVANSFKRYLDALRTFETEHKLTSKQSDVLRKAEALAPQTGRL